MKKRYFNRSSIVSRFQAASASSSVLYLSQFLSGRLFKDSNTASHTLNQYDAFYGRRILHWLQIIAIQSSAVSQKRTIAIALILFMTHHHPVEDCLLVNP